MQDVTALDQDYETDADPAAAFEALRREVAQLHRAIERLSSGPPDYSPTLSEMAKRLTAIEAQPALQSTSAEVAEQMRRAQDKAYGEAKASLNIFLGQMKEGAQLLNGLVTNKRDRRQQTRQLLLTAAGSAFIAVILWLLVSGPVIRALGERWGWPEMIAAATMNMGRGAAGGKLLQGAAPIAWGNAMLGKELVETNSDSINACRKQAAGTGKPQKCLIKVAPPQN